MIRGGQVDMIILRKAKTRGSISCQIGVTCRQIISNFFYSSREYGFDIGDAIYMGESK